MFFEKLFQLGGNFLEVLISWGYPGAFLGSILDRVLISLIPTEVFLPTYGFLSERGSFNLVFLFGVISLGAISGEIILYLIFLKGGRAFLEKFGKYFLISRHDFQHLDELFFKHGSKIVFWGRFLPVVRSIVAIPAGISKMNPTKFIVYSFLGMLPYNFLLFYLGSRLSDNWDELSFYFKKFDTVGLLIFLILIFWYVFRHLRGRHFSHG